MVCYLLPDLADDPLARAAAWIRAQDWEVVAVEDAPERCLREQAPDTGYFDQALSDGEVYVFHQWPLDDIGHETRH